MFTLTVIILVAVSFCQGCATPTPVKIYKLDYYRGYMVRDLINRDVLTLQQAHGFLCFSKEDFKKLADDLADKKASVYKW